MGDDAWPALLNVHQASAYLGMSKASFEVFAKTKGLRPANTGLRLRRWRRRDLDQLVEELPGEDGGPADSVSTRMEDVFRRAEQRPPPTRGKGASTR